MKLNFCTYFDHNYLPRGLVLYESLKKHSPEARLFILCLSPECRAILDKLALPDVTLYNLEDLEAADKELLAVKSTRKLAEYYFTLSPCWPRFLLQRHPEVDVLTYVDADAAFFSDPAPAIEEMGEAAVSIVGHRFSEKLKHLERFGIFNVGWESFRNSAEGLRCLEWWREKCMEWCGDYIDGNRFADQKYLDSFPDLFAVKILEHPGVNAAPWNIANYRLESSGWRITLDGRPLIFYHFQGLRRLAWNFWELGLNNYNVRANAELKQLYYQYICKLQSKTAEAGLSDGGASKRAARPKWLRFIKGLVLGRLQRVRC